MSNARALISEGDAQSVAATCLSHVVACGTALSVDQVYNALTFVPDNMLGLLESPEGWSALASYVAANEGLPEPRLKPSVH